jgi:AmmeMemoRadiSam system protein B
MKRITPHLREKSVTDCPHIRAGLEPFRYEDEKKQFFIGLKDPLELSDLVILLPQDLYFLLQYFDGEHSLDDMTSVYMRQFNSFLDVGRLKKLIKKMDDALLLVNKRSEKRLQQIESAYQKQTVRPPVCVGSSYAGDKSDLEKELQQYLKKATSDVPTHRFQHKTINGMVLPHIDPRLGGAAYASAYKILENAHPIDLFVILGISHQHTAQPFVVTAQDFDTPLGLVQTDKELLNAVLDECKTDFRRDELVHRDEHSIEFQTIFLKHCYKSDFKILPVLCSFSYDMDVQERDQFAEFTQAMRSVLNSFDGRICFIAGVDFSHIGPYYGDEFIPDSYLLAKVERLDKAILESLAQQDKKEFDRHFSRSQNKYNICGYPAMRTLLEFLPPSNATLLTYDNAIMDDQRSTVTFASMIFS